MWKRQITNPLKNVISNFLQSESVVLQQSRNTFILKRRYPPRLHKKNQKPHVLKGRNHIYDLIEDTEMKPLKTLDVILTTYVEGVGSAGQFLSVRPHFAYNKLLLPKLAVYASPENIEKYKNMSEQIKESDSEHSSPFAQRTVGVLSRHVYPVIMNKEVPWVVEPWHIQASLRKGGVECPLEAITMPSQEIKGPDMSLENKDFFVTVTVNNKEQARVCCRIHHWSTEPSGRLPYVFEYWKLPAEKIFNDETNQ